MFDNHLVPPKPLWEIIGFFIFQELYLIEPEWVLKTAMDKFNLDFQMMSEEDINFGISYQHVQESKCSYL